MLQRVIMSPLGATLALVILFAVWSMTTGSINGWYLLTESAGEAVGERFDRVVGFASGEESDAAWKDAVIVTAGAATGLGDGNAIVIKKGTTANSDGSYPCEFDIASGTVTGKKAYTPLGNEITYGNTSAGTTVTITGCKYKEPADVFTTGGLGTLIKLILSACGLGLPIGAIIALARFGGNFISDMFSGSPLIGTIVLIIGLILVGSLLNVLTPFVDVALDSLDGTRFVMYAEGIGSLSSVIGNFWGVVIVGGLLAVAWQVISQFRSGSEGGGGFFGNADGVRMGGGALEGLVDNGFDAASNIVEGIVKRVT